MSRVWNVYLMNFGSALYLLSGRKLTNAVYSLSLSGATKDFHGKAGMTLFRRIGCYVAMVLGRRRLARPLDE